MFSPRTSTLFQTKQNTVSQVGRRRVGGVVWCGVVWGCGGVEEEEGKEVAYFVAAEVRVERRHLHATSERNERESVQRIIRVQILQSPILTIEFPFSPFSSFSSFFPPSTTPHLLNPTQSLHSPHSAPDPDPSSSLQTPVFHLSPHPPTHPTTPHPHPHTPK